MSAQLGQSARKRTATPAALSMAPKRTTGHQRPNPMSASGTTSTRIVTPETTCINSYSPMGSATFVVTCATTSSSGTSDTCTTSLPQVGSLTPVPVHPMPNPNTYPLGSAIIGSTLNNMPSYASSNSSDNDHNVNLPCQIQSFQSDLAFNVPQNIREKIQKSEFIDL